jgi:hypothetical protein
MYKPIVLSSLILLSNAILFSRNPRPTIVPIVASAGADVQVRELLADLGKKYDVTFTIEEAILKDHVMGRIRGSRQRSPDEDIDLKATLENLSQTVPSFTWQTDANNPKIIHIIDEHLLHRNGYALDRKIDGIDFTGTVGALVDAIAAKGIPVSSAGVFDSHELMFTDFNSSVEVKGKNLSVRDALSDFVPLGGRGRILWFAETHVDGTDATTYVRFQGAPPKTPAPND